VARLLLLFLLCFGVPAHATTFEGRVIRVKDGDSLLVWRPDVKRTSEIRLAGIDAPELSQPWGIQSRSALRRLVMDRPVTVTVVDRDRYDRLVGQLWQGRIYVNAELARGGHAWAFDRYRPDPRIRAAHNEARAAQRGLWSLPPADRLPPATWRDLHPRSAR
jgi:endonuclease YncB( thermonuclease family)